MSDNVLQLTNVSKAYGGIHALSDVTFSLQRGEVHALIGENGAGKSTLIKIISGAISSYEGTMEVNGEEVHLANTYDGQHKGIAAIYQERSLIPILDGATNIMLGQEPVTTKGQNGWINKKELRSRAKSYADMVAPDLDLTSQVKNLSAAQQQLIEIAKALSRDPNIIIMDEPTSSLTDNETVLLIEVVKNLRNQGKSIIFISHKLPDVFAVADRITVLRDGHVIETRNAEGVTEGELIQMMVGRSVQNLFPKENIKTGDEVLRVENLSRKGKFENISFSVKAGEIVGVSGLVGAGRSEVAMCIYGADKLDEGKVYMEGKEVSIKSPRDAVRLGIDLVPEDRKFQGLIQGMSIKENMTLSILEQTSRFYFKNKKKQEEIVDRFMDRLEIKAPTKDMAVRNLSGGNQQKVVIGKWLAAGPKLLILDEPTRGIDVGTKAEIYKLIGELASQGLAILLISSEMPEILGMSDRILVMRNGSLVAEMNREEATEEKILQYYLGKEG